MNRLRFFALSALAVLGLSVTSIVADDKPVAKAVVVPFETLKSGHMAVSVKVNGKGPYLLVFDTGAPMSLVNNKLAEEAGLLKGTLKSPFAMFGAQGAVKVKKLEVGDQAVEDVEAIVMDHPTVDALGRGVGKTLYGIVGFPFFARFKMTLDYKAKTMTLIPSGYRPPDVMKAMTGAMLGSGWKTLAPSAQWGLIAEKETGDVEDGVDVKSVVPGSASEKAGIKRGDRILTLDGRWTDSLKDLWEAAGFVKADTTVVVKVRRGGKEMELKVTPVRGL